MNIAGHFVFFSYYSAVSFQVLKSVNRFCAIVFARYYSSIFTINKTLAIIAVLFLISLLRSYPYLSYSCNVGYHPIYYVLIVRGPICDSIMLKISPQARIFFQVISLLMDSATLLYLRFIKRKIHRRFWKFNLKMEP